jgi:DNA polymerase-1
VIKTLLVDGNNLLKIGFHGVKEFYHKGEHVGGIYHFLNTIRKFVQEQNFDKVVVFWDGEESASKRKLIYPQYKLNRRTPLEENKLASFERQKQRIKQYLEEVFIRQLDVDGNEADDMIAYYCSISEDENKVIFSADRDLTQLISDQVSIYSPNTKKTYKKGDKIPMKECEIPHYNIKTFKILSGDNYFRYFNKSGTNF